MNRIYMHAVHAASALLVACCMLLINYGFEAAGSVPDFPACGFMAGSIWLLIMLYPAAAGVIAYYGTTPALRRARTPAASVCRSAWIASGSGAILYFAAAALLLALQGRLGTTPPIAWCVSALCSVISAAGGGAGALLALERRPAPDLQGQEG